MLKTNLIFILLAVSFISLKLSAQTNDTINIYFDINSYSIGSGYFDELDKISASKPEKITILAYTDFLGSVESNKTLSENRAEAVKNYLIKKGISVSIISSCEGKGIHTFSSYENRRNENDRGIREHRKAEIIVTFKPQEKIKEIKPKDIVYTDTFRIKPVIENSDAIDLSNLSAADLTEGKKLIIKNINFEGGTPKFLSSSYPALNDLLAIMRENPGLKIEICGHICCQDPSEPDGYDYVNDNNTLSLNRAEAVYNFLIKNGISADRMTYKGFGAKFKLYPLERTEYEQSANRRVEIVIIGNE
jgi:outer membrane protein OmpA-like peptidoglycan-associated protein